jgi:hypothetical protein
MKPGDLRRFQDDAFFANEKEFNGLIFLVLPWWSPHCMSILVNGKLSTEWSYSILHDNSRPVNETR